VTAGASLGCTIVRIYGSDDEVRIERHVGLASIGIASTHAPVLAELRSLGIASSPFGFQAGWASQSLSVLPPSCHVVIWVEDAEALRKVRSELDTLPHVCAVSAGQGEHR
jgi:hypothetical protein